MLENHLQNNSQGHSMSFLQRVAELRSQVSPTYSSNQEKCKLLFTDPCINGSISEEKEDSVAGAGYYGYMHYSLETEKSSQQSLYTLTIFVYEGSSLPAAVWRCHAENPTLFMPVKDFVTFMHLKQCILKAAKLMRCGIGPLSSLSPCFALCKSDLSFLTSVPLVITEHPRLEGTSKDHIHRVWKRRWIDCQVFCCHFVFWF